MENKDIDFNGFDSEEIEFANSAMDSFREMSVEEQKILAKLMITGIVFCSNKYEHTRRREYKNMFKIYNTVVHYICDKFCKEGTNSTIRNTMRKIIEKDYAYVFDNKGNKA